MEKITFFLMILVPILSWVQAIVILKRTKKVRIKFLVILATIFINGAYLFMGYIIFH